MKILALRRDGRRGLICRGLIRPQWPATRSRAGWVGLRPDPPASRPLSARVCPLRTAYLPGYARMCPHLPACARVCSHTIILSFRTGAMGSEATSVTLARLVLRGAAGKVAGLFRLHSPSGGHHSVVLRLERPVNSRPSAVFGCQAFLRKHRTDGRLRL